MSKIVRGKRNVPVEEAEKWADALGLEGEKREDFLNAVHLKAATPRIQKLVKGLMHQLKCRNRKFR